MSPYVSTKQKLSINLPESKSEGWYWMFFLRTVLCTRPRVVRNRQEKPHTDYGPREHWHMNQGCM